MVLNQIVKGSSWVSSSHFKTRGRGDELDLRCNNAVLCYFHFIINMTINNTEFKASLMLQ